MSVNGGSSSQSRYHTWMDELASDRASAASGERATELIGRPSPRRMQRHSPLSICHSRSVPSSLPDSTSAPSDENATERTGPVCPSKLRRHLPVATSHRLASSKLPDKASVPSGENATDI